MSIPSLAYVAGGRLHVKAGDAPLRSFDSTFGQQVRDRHTEIQQRHSWKEEGRGARFMSGLLWGGPQAEAAGLHIAFTGLSRGLGEGELLYALDTDGRTAVCALRCQDGAERRLIHGSPQRMRDLCARPGQGQIACSVQHPDGTASIAVMDASASDLRELTEGDAQDRSPSWAGGPGARLVYQSAGAGRAAGGHHIARLAASEIHLLDLDRGTLETLASEPGRDLLTPRLDAEGTLYYIRRPHWGATSASPLRMLLDLLLLPFRLVYAIFQYLNFFSARYTGKPLTTAGGPKRQGVDARQMMVWSNLMASGDAGPEEPESSVPRSWQLVRVRAGQKAETLAEGVLAFDLAPDGSILYTTGAAIHHIGPDGAHQRLLSGERVEALVAL